MRFSWRIILLVLTLVSLTALANLWLTNYQGRLLHYKSERILAETIARSLSETLVQDIIDGNRLRVIDQLLRIKNSDIPIDFLYITDESHRVFAHSFERGFPRYLLHNVNAQESSGTRLIGKYQTDSGVTHEYSSELIPGLESRLHIGISQSTIEAMQAENSRRILLFGLVILGAALLLAFLLARQIVTPINRLTRAVSQSGDLKPIDFDGLQTSPPEIRLLAETINRATQARQQATHELENREKNLAITLNSIGDAVIATDANGIITRINPVAAKLTGWPEQQAIGETVTAVFPIINASTRETIDNPIDSVMKTGETVYLSNHTTLLSKDGREYQIADSAAPIKDEAGNIEGMVLIFNDVTEQYQLRESLIKSRNDLQAIMNNSPAAIYAKDLEGRYIFVNRVFEQRYQLSQQQVVGKTDAQLFSPSMASKFESQHKMALQAGKTIELEEQNLVDGDNRHYRIGLFPLRNDSDEIYAICGISSDISERVQQEEMLRRSQKMESLGKLTGGIAHDFNNMLSIITGYAELLEAKLAGQDKLIKYAAEIHRAGLRGASLTRKLLAFSRKESTEVSVVDINELLKNQQLILEKTLTVKYRLELDLAAQLWPVNLDSNDFDDAIINLAINAMHAMEAEPGGLLSFQTGNLTISSIESRILQIPEGDYVRVSVTDTGCGMDSATKQKIFEPFFSTKGEKGTGLGLSQVYGFVERSSGIVKVYSEPGRGTQFEFYFPRYRSADERQTAERSAQTSEPPQTADATNRHLILVVDDEPALQTLASEILNQHGYQTLCANNAREALEILRNTDHIDLVLSDVIMPAMDGYQLAALIREHYPKVKIQLASGFSDQRHSGHEDDSLHRNLLHKPYNSADLLQRIRQLLSR